MEEADKFAQEAVMKFLKEHHIELASAAAWGGFVLDNYLEQSESEENTVPTNFEALMLEQGKIQYLLMQILAELRKG